MEATLEAIKHYVLNPDQNGSHLRQLADYMGRLAWENDAGKPMGQKWQDVMDFYVGNAAEEVARFVHLGWDGADSAEYAPRTFEIMCDYRDSMSGMDPYTIWNENTLPKMANEIRMRMRVAGQMAINSDAENALVKRLLGDNNDDAYLHDVVGKVEHLHWERKHSHAFQAWLADHPEHPLYYSLGKKNYVWGDRGDEVVERHLRRTAIAGLALFTEQSNLVRPDGDILNPTNPRIIYMERINLQDHYLDGRNARSWEDSGWMLAHRIEESVCTTEGRNAIRRARLGWKATTKRASDEAA